MARRKLGPREEAKISKLLRECQRRGGMTTREMRLFVWRLAHPGERDPRPKDIRGWWGANLYGSQLLERFCMRDARRVWRVTEPIEPPFYARETRTLALNRRARMAEMLLREREAIKCTGCFKPVYHDRDQVPDGAACWAQWSRWWRRDCRGRYWSSLTGEVMTLTPEIVANFENIVGLTVAPGDFVTRERLLGQLARDHTATLKNVVPVVDLTPAEPPPRTRWDALREELDLDNKGRN